VIAAEPSEWAVESGRIETPYFSSRLPQWPPKASRRITQIAKPIIEEPYPNSFRSLCNEGVTKLIANVIFVENETFKMNKAFGTGNGFQPGRIVLLSVLQNPHSVTGNEGGAGSS
jgi:hypothetical protein